MTQALFYIFGAGALASALLAVTRKNPVASAVWLVVMFFSLAGTYVLLEAWFVAVVQVLVYAGAIMVLFLFVIMLLDLRNETLEAGPPVRMPLLGIASAILFAGLGLLAVHKTQAGTQPSTDPVTGQPEGSAFFQQNVTPSPTGEPVIADMPAGAGEIGDAIFTRWLLAFEITSILLLGAILGAVILTKRRLT